MSSQLHKSNEYRNFRATVPLRKVCVDENTESEWNFYETGPRNINTPIVCLPPISGTADIFYKQILALATDGYRVFSVEYPIYWKCDEFCIGLKKLLDHFQLSKVHLLGASLGGFLAQKFAETFPDKVCSLILCNAFADTSIFEQVKSASALWMLPCVILRKMVSNNLKSQDLELDIRDSIEFVLESLKSLNQKQLASRLTLNCLKSSVESHLMNNLPITILNVRDKSAICSEVQKNLLERYPQAEEVSLELGGNFPYLSKSSEVDKVIKHHLQRICDQNQNGPTSTSTSTTENLENS